MDKITASFLADFAKEQELTKLSEDKQFEHFAAYLIIGKVLAESFNTEDVIVGGGGDLGIDAIAIVVNGSLVTSAEAVDDLATRNGYLEATFVFVQAERSSGFDASKISDFTYGVIDFFRSKPKLPRNKTVAELAKVMQQVYGRSSKFSRGNPACKLLYVTTGQWQNDLHLRGRLDTSVEDISRDGTFSDVTFAPIGAKEIQKLHKEITNSVQREFDFTIRAVVPEIQGVDEAYIGLLPARQFLTLVEDEDGEMLRGIFYDNVRDWQDFNIVNTEMKKTLESETLKNRFALMNNGVTIIAKSLRLTGHRVHISDYQVVNGCQTSHVLHHAKNRLTDAVSVPLRLIATKDEDVIASIIKATNRQTEVKEEQLLASSDFQKRLENFFATFRNGKRLYYERRSRQYNSVSGIEKTRIVTLSSLIRSFAAMFLEEPHRTTRSYRDILEGVGTKLFVDTDKLDPYYVAALALYRIEYLFRNQILSGDFKPARYQILLAFRILTAPGTLPRPNAHEMERYCAPIMEKLWDTKQSESLFKRAAQAVSSVAKNKLDSDQVRTQPFTEALKKHCAQAQNPQSEKHGSAKSPEPTRRKRRGSRS